MAKQMIDIGLDISEDLLISDGDFQAVESTARHQQQLIMNANGDFKQNPTICIGIYDFLHDENFQELMRSISLGFTKDGMEVSNVTLTPDGIVNSDAFYP